MLVISAAGAAAAIMVVGIVDVIRLGGERFAVVGKRRYHWVLLIILFGPLAVLLYAGAVRPQLVHPERYSDEFVDPAARSMLHAKPEAEGSRAG